jgi:hypothetical protein
VKRLPLVALVALLSHGIAASPAQAKGIEMAAAGQGVTVSGSPYRYVSITPNARPRHTIVVRIDRRGGTLSRWWHLRGSFSVPAVAYDVTGGGLSADGRTLVLSGFTREYPPRTARFALLDTDLFLRHPRRPGQRRPLHAISYVNLDGHFAFDAISPDGSTIYLIHYLSETTGLPYLPHYEVRAYDVKSGRLLPEPIVDPDEPEERMEGLPLTRAMSPDGRWAYTLYDGNGKKLFVHALDTVAGRAVCVDLPQLTEMPSRFYYLLQLQMSEGGRRLVLLRRVPGQKPTRALLSIDGQDFAVQRAAAVATASSGIGPWPPVLAVSAVALALLAWAGRRQRRTGVDESAKRQ